MKIISLLPLFYFYSHFHENLAISESLTYCESEDENIVWKCVSNQDQTLNITIDCLLSNTSINSAEVWIWSSHFPIQMKALTIQNCGKLVLDTNCNGDQDRTNFLHLEIKNVSNLILGERNKFETIPHHMDNYGHLPTFTTFKNIQNAIFTTSLVSPFFKARCRNLTSFKSVELINVTVDCLKQNFIGYSFDLTNFLMDNVTILNVEGTSIITINSTNAIVKIANSKLPDLSTDFMNCNASEVIFSGNSFGQLHGAHDKAVFHINANKFSLLGNVISYWESDSFSILSSLINISRNTFERVDLLEPNYVLMFPFNTRVLKNSFVFSNNVIHSITRNTFAPVGLYYDAYFFDFFNIFNNLVDCSCMNFPWFDYMAKHELESFTSHVQLSKWFNNKNNNRCFNLSNCTLNQVLHNFEELCKENYTCQENDVFYSLNKAESVLIDLLSTVNDVEISNSKILSVLTNKKINEKNMFDVIEKNQDDVNLENFCPNGSPYQKEMYLCLIIIGCLSFILLSYHVFITHKKYSLSKKYLASYFSNCKCPTSDT